MAKAACVSAMPGVWYGSAAVDRKLDTVGREDEVEVEGAVLELDEVLAAANLCGLIRCQREAQRDEGLDQGLAIGGTTLDEDVGVLSRVGEPEENGARLAEEQIADTVARERIAELLGLGVLKPAGHSPGSSASCLHTTDDSRPWS